MNENKITISLKEYDDFSRKQKIIMSKINLLRSHDNIPNLYGSIAEEITDLTNTLIKKSYKFSRT